MRAVAQPARRLDAGGSAGNLVLMLRWSEDERVGPVAYFEELFNAEGSSEYAPTGSVRSFFRNNSLGRLDLRSELSGWLEANMTQAEAKAGGLLIAIRAGIAAVEAAMGAKLFVQRFDHNGDGEVDALTVRESRGGAVAENTAWPCRPLARRAPSRAV
jgi:hypothetical protein